MNIYYILITTSVLSQFHALIKILQKSRHLKGMCFCNVKISYT